MSLELYHYGVKGMKWGVRKEYQSRPKQHSTDKRSEKKKQINKKVVIGSITTVSALAVIGGVAIYKYKTKAYKNSIDIASLKIGQYKVSDLVSDDTVIPKGSKLFRTSTHQTLHDGPIYMSTNKKDRDRYIRVMSQKYKDVYQMKIKSTKDLKIPSEKKQMDMFVDLLTNDASFSSDVTNNPYGFSKNVFGNRRAAEDFAKDYHYDNFITKMINYDPSKKDSLSKFAEYVKSNGYDCLIDTNDIRTVSDNPIIALNKNDLIVDSSKKINLGIKFVSGLKLKKIKV